MPALAPYIPAQDTLFNSWINNFSTLLTAAPATYGVTPGDAAAVAAVTLTWDNAYALVTSPSTKTPDAVSAKDTARINATATVRPYAQNISLNAGVESSDKIALGINPRTSVPIPITNPTTYPLITISQALALTHILHYRDQIASPTVKAKPYGVIGMQLFAKASTTVITDPTLLAFLQTATKSPLMQGWGSGDVGKQAYYAGRWATRTGLVGPWSPIVNFTIAG